MEYDPRAQIVADHRKFRDFVLVPGKHGGKDRIFLKVLGFRARSSSDAWSLAKGVFQGAIGVILDVYVDGYKVEFSRPDGTTIAWFAVRPEDVEAVFEAAASMPARKLV